MAISNTDCVYLAQGVVARRKYRSYRQNTVVRTHNHESGINNVGDAMDALQYVSQNIGPDPQGRFYPIDTTEIRLRGGGKATQVDTYKLPTAPSGTQLMGGNTTVRRFKWFGAENNYSATYNTTAPPSGTEIKSEQEQRGDYREFYAIEFFLPFQVSAAPVTQSVMQAAGKCNSAGYDILGYVHPAYTLIFLGPSGMTSTAYGNNVLNTGAWHFLKLYNGWYVQREKTDGTFIRLLAAEPIAFPFLPL